MRLLLLVLFFNPILLAAATWAAWYYGGLPGLVMALIGPMLPWLLWTNYRKGFWSYIAGMQGFLASCILGSVVILYAMDNGSFLIGVIGGFLLLPAFALALLAIFLSN